MRRLIATTTIFLCLAACSTQSTDSADDADGDASVSVTAQGPREFVRPLEPGEEPPQFVVFSWDGGGNPNLQERFRNVMAEHDGHMTIFLTGIYFVPKDKRKLYHPPGREPGDSDIAFARSDESARNIIQSTVNAWEDGHEIGTHFNGHFCGPDGVASWTPDMWRSEIDQSVSFVDNFKEHTGFTDMADLPFSHGDDIQGARTPCLEGQANLLPVAEELGWTYDSSGSGPRVWPRKFTEHDLWNIPLQFMPWHDGGTVIGMDYNYMFKQSKGQSDPDPTNHARYQEEMRASLTGALDESLTTNRAPIVIGNHYNDWNGGAYMNAVEDVMRDAGGRDDVILVSFEELVAWLEVQDPATLKKLQALDVGQAPPGGWEAYLTATPATEVTSEVTTEDDGSDDVDAAVGDETTSAATIATTTGRSAATDKNGIY